jgi:hypothetical protein
MPGEAARKAPQKDQEQQDERQQQRQQDQQPQEEKHQQQRREGSGTSNTGTGTGPSNPGPANTGMNRDEMNRDAMSGREGTNRQTEKWPGENSQSGTSQAQKGDGRTPAEQTDKHQQSGNDDASSQNSREDRDTGFGENRQKTGGNVDSGQRNTGQTGQTMKGDSSPEIHPQEGPYGPPGKHRGPSSPGKPLTDDWGKSDKH